MKRLEKFMAPRAQVAEKNSRKPDKAPISALGLVSPPPILVEAPTFKGSLAFLFECVKDRKVDLREVPLAPICETYFEYLMGQENPPIDEAAAALMALSYLIERKCWLLLPTAEPEPEEDDPLQLPDPSAHMYAIAMEELEERRLQREDLFFRQAESGPDAYEVPMSLGAVTAGDLARALERLLRKAVPEPIQPLNRPRRSLQEMIGRALRALTPEFRPLDAFIDWPFTREDAVYWFLSLLELIRLGRCAVRIEADEVAFAAVSYSA